MREHSAATAEKKACETADRTHLAGHAHADARGAERLEPVGEDRRALVARPRHDRLGDRVGGGGGGGPRRVVEEARGEALLGEVLVGDGALEAVLAVVLDRRHEGARARREHRRGAARERRSRTASHGTSDERHVKLETESGEEACERAGRKNRSERFGRARGAGIAQENMW